MTERDRDWQSFLRTPECRRHTVEAVTRLCRWWFLQGVIRDLRRERGRSRRRQFCYFVEAEAVNVEEFERVSARTDVTRL